MLPYLGICHAAALLILTLAALRSSPLDWITKLNAAILAGWTNLVLTAVVLSFGSALGQPVLFAAVSTVIAVGSALLLAGAGLMPATPGKPLVSFLEDRPRLARLLLAFFVITGAGVLLGNLIIALAYLPNNPDTVTYRLSRIYWYRDAGSLAHFGTGIDARSIFYPFNGALLQYPIALYRWTNRLFSLVPFVAWTIIGLTVFRIARDLGACRTVAAGTAWLAALTPGVVVQATSTNDEILAAFPLLIAVQFAIRFHRGGAVADLCLALIAAALSIGTKLHAVFYWPVIVAAAGWLAWRLASGDRWDLSWPTSRRAVLTVSTLALCAVLAGAFVVPNWRASGALMDTGFSDLVLNKPFKLLAGLQNLVLHVVQTAASPLPDLNPARDIQARLSFHTAFNQAAAGLFTWVNQGPEYMSVSYRFVGPSQSTGWYLGENSVDIGFVYLIGVVAFGVALRRRIAVGIALGSAFVAWFVTYSLMTRYIEGFSVYLNYAFIVASPGLVFFWLKGSRRFDALRLALLGFAAATHLVLDANVLRFNVSRNLGTARVATSWPVNPPAVDATIVEAIKANGGARLMATHWEVAYWYLIVPYKEGRYSVASPHLPDPGGLNIFSFQKLPVYSYVPIRIPDKRSPGLTLIGSYGSAYGPEWAFATGRGVDEAVSSRSRYVVLQLQEQTNFGQQAASTLDILPTVWGLAPADALQFRYVLRGSGGEETVSDWSDAPARALPRPANLKGSTLVVEIREKDSPKAPVVTEFPLGSTEPFALPDAPS
ncbi:MAG: hypothetical protein ACJ8A4_07750 [Microvirga sp.]